MSQKTSQNKIDYFKDNKKLKIFMLFLVLSILFWMLIKLSKNYIADVNFNVEYIDVPQKKLLQNQPPEQIKLTVKTIGFKLLGYSFKNGKIKYSLTDISRKKGSEYYSVTKANVNFIQSQLPAEVTVLKVKPDTLLFDLGNKKSKKVEVSTQVNLRFKPGYNLTKAFTIEPKEVTISGPAKYVDSIEYIDADVLDLENISESFRKEIALQIPNDNLALSTDKVILSGTVAKITEGYFMVPLQMINVPKNYILTTYPKEVKVIYQVALKDYNKIAKNNFEVVCDYSHSEKNNLNYLIPQLVDSPDILFDVKIIPNKVEFLIKK